MSGCPGDTGPIIKFFKNRSVTSTNDQIIKLAGGKNEFWGEYLKGAKVQAIVAKANGLLADDGLAIVSEGVGSEEWRIVSLAEAHRRKAEWNLSRIDGPYKRANDAVMKMSLDERAPARLRRDAKAWLQLFEEPLTKRGLTIMSDFAERLLGQMPKPHKMKLVPDPEKPGRK